MIRRAIVLATVLCGGACASTVPKGIDPGSEGEGACPSEVRNETEVSLAITYRAGLIRVGELAPGARLRFDVDCEEGSLVEGQMVVASLQMSRRARTSANPTGCWRGSDHHGADTQLETPAPEDAPEDWFVLRGGTT